MLKTDERRSGSIDGKAHRVHHLQQGGADDVVTELLIAALTAAAGLCKRRAPTTTTSRVAAGLVRRSAVTGSHAALRMRLVVGLSLGLELLLYQSDCACRSEPIATCHARSVLTYLVLRQTSEEAARSTARLMQGCSEAITEHPAACCYAPVASTACTTCREKLMT